MRSRALLLLACCGALLLLRQLLLLADTGSQVRREQLVLIERHEIEPAALFYTELGAALAAEKRTRRNLESAE